jgi:TetR/AcrR family transcriptional regulator, transcriptional repressor for nem operon
MARYPPEHKEATRQRILERAGRRFKRDGIDGSGVATLMTDAGLTNGAFYAHFASKDDLVAAVITDQLHSQRDRYGETLTDRAGFEQLVRDYLSPAHRDSPDEGCPSAALLDEIARADEATKRAYTDGLLGLIDHVAVLLPPSRGTPARVQALSLFASMIGTLQLSRALSDRLLADAVLQQGIDDVLSRMPTKRRASRPFIPRHYRD